ncbi:PadR family transcriptional regulator [Roseiarcus fermentans]|uniref:PadR family transcriptional regulator n=1 Tax=Roseiarcus fermentans TaxID=1473586 RepID=A0A366FGL0_9HYPH|nr:PadR family transcriptional regulator [Roseiarcus fermentans]RBP13813.1 PadR family transcriptional regulator [Roseiarcus fermentans]
MPSPFRPPPPGDDEAPDCGPRAAFRGLFGRHRGGPFGRWRGARMFDSGALRLLALGLIAEEPRHGYDIIRVLRARFQGSYSPSPGSIYPILQQLSDAGLVTSSSHGPRRRFAITEAGKSWLAGQSAELDAIKVQLDEAASPIGEQAIGEAIRDLRQALFSKMREGALDAGQARRLRDVLERARREIEDL